MSFPVVQPEKESQNEECVQRTKQDLKEDKPLRGYHILLAEDNEINMEIAEFYLEEAGAQVTKAWNGREAAELFKQSGLREYDAVLMDIMMPELDGKEASRKIRSMADQREDAAKIPILAMTAQASTESIHQCKAAGMNECIFKPVNAKELIRLLQDIVAKYKLRGKENARIRCCLLCCKRCKEGCGGKSCGEGFCRDTGDWGSVRNTT